MLCRWAMHGSIRVVCDVTKCHWASDFGRFDGFMLPSFLGSCSPSFFSPRDTLSYLIRLVFSNTAAWSSNLTEYLGGVCQSDGCIWLLPMGVKLACPVFVVIWPLFLIAVRTNRASFFFRYDNIIASLVRRSKYVLISEGLITKVQVRTYLWPFCLDVFDRASKNVKTNSDTLVWQ